MSKSRNGIVTIGAALTDIVTRVEHDLIAKLGLTMGGMELVDRETARKHYDAVGVAHEVAGGSAANTAAIAGSLGAAATFIGKVARDDLGDIFLHDMKSQGVALSTDTLDDPGHHTGRCLSMITPDGQRTMSTHLGAAHALTPEDLDPKVLSDAAYVFLEAYLLDAPQGAALFETAASHTAGTLVLTLSDPNCVARHHTWISENIHRFDMIFCNAEELAALYDGETIHHRLLSAGTDLAHIVCTDGGNGVYLHRDNQTTHMPARKVVPVDTTGAGDSFAGTYLWALDAGLNPEEAARLALVVAADIVTTIGARPMRSLRELLDAEGLTVPA